MEEPPSPINDRGGGHQRGSGSVEVLVGETLERILM